MSSYIKIYSGNRLNPTTTNASDCVIPVSHVLHGRYTLKAIKMPITYYNINSFNNLVYFTDSAPQTCTIPSRYYSSLTALAAALAAAMTAAGAGTVTCSVNSGTNVLTVTSTVAFTFTFGTNTVNSAASVLGFVGDSSLASTSQIGTQTMNLNSTLSFNIAIDNTSTEVREGSYGCTFVIPALTSTPNEVYYEPTLHFPIRFNVTESTKQLRVRILDDRYRVLNNMTSDWYMLLHSC